MPRRVTEKNIAMSLAAKAESPSRRLGSRRPLEVARDLGVLIGAALAIGVAVSFGLILAVVSLS
jgi:hypothetical protein